MDVNSYDLEFFDFENVSEEEIKEIHAILKSSGNNGSVELPWETSLKENPSEESLPENEDVYNVDPATATKSTKILGAVVEPALHFTPQTPLSLPAAQLPLPAVEAFIAPHTTVGPYPSHPYFVSRTIPYLRAYPHMGMPFFACPIPATGETSPLSTPYGQFVPIVPATMAQEKFVSPIENETSLKNRPSERSFNRRSKKKSSSEYFNSSFESETIVDTCRESTLSDGQTSISTPISSVNERPTSVPLVPLPVPSSNFGVAGSTLPMHGYPPGLHTLPYTHMTGHPAHSAAMYYVPVFNPPYSSYLPSPSSTTMVLPINLHPESSSPVHSSSHENVVRNVESVVPKSIDKVTESVSPELNCEQTNTKHSNNFADQKTSSMDSAAKIISEVEYVTDCNSSSDYPISNSSSPDYVPDTGITDDCYNKCLSTSEDLKQTGQDSSRCWADLFKSPHSEVNGIDSQHMTQQQRHNNTNTLKTTNDKPCV